MNSGELKQLIWVIVGGVTVCTSYCNFTRSWSVNFISQGRSDLSWFLPAEYWLATYCNTTEYVLLRQRSFCVTSGHFILFFQSLTFPLSTSWTVCWQSAELWASSCHQKTCHLQRLWGVGAEMSSSRAKWQSRLITAACWFLFLALCPNYSLLLCIVCCLFQGLDNYSLSIYGKGQGGEALFLTSAVVPSSQQQRRTMVTLSLLCWFLILHAGSHWLTCNDHKIT